MTALTAYLTSTNDTLLATARQLTNAAPASTATAASGQYAKSGTGWTELFSQGAGTTLAGSEPAPSGHGFIWDVTSLEGQTLAAGTFTPTIRIGAVATGFTADVFVRVWKRSSGGTYTQIGSDVLVASAYAITASLVAKSASASLPATDFVTGDKLYVDVVAHITTGSSNNTATNRVINLGENSGANDAVVTPGYATTPPTYNDTATGKLLLTGAKAESTAFDSTVSGKLFFTGSKAESPSFASTVSGKLLLTGTAVDQWGFIYNDAATGKLLLTGSKAESTVFSSTAAGKLLFTGSKVENQAYGDLAAGKLLFTGSKVESWTPGPATYNDAGIGKFVLRGSATERIHDEPQGLQIKTSPYGGLFWVSGGHWVSGG